MVHIEKENIRIHRRLVFREWWRIVGKLCKYISLKHKGGRNCHYDFQIAFTSHDMETLTYNVEFKFNQDNIYKIAEFVQPFKPSKFMSNNFEEDYYDNGYLHEILYEMPDNETGYIDEIERDVYLKEVHCPKPNCMKHVQEQYKIAIIKQPIIKERKNDNDNFHTFCNTVSKKTYNSIKKTELYTDVLTQYLVEHQIEKNYMFYSKKKEFIHTLQCKDDFILLKDYTINKHGNGYTCKTIKGDLINVLLRWKNGNGIAFPAFQISRTKE